MYICDGASPGAAVLSDGAAVYTPGLSEHRLSSSYTGTRFVHADMLGSLTFLSDSTQTSTAGYGFDAYGSLASSWFPNGADPTPFGWLSNAGCQTDHDSGLVLMGYRYYDTRTGSFITQDPAGDGDNWYAYCDNNPVIAVDPEGLHWVFTPEYDPTQGQMLPDGAIDMGRTLMQWVPDGPTSSGGGSNSAYDTTDAGMGFGGLVDNWVTFGTVANAARVAGAYDSHHASRGAAIGAGGLAIGAVLAAGATDGGDAAEVDSARLMEQWSKASFKSIGESLIYHFGEHGEEVGANSILQYMRKAEAFNQNLRGASLPYTFWIRCLVDNS